ncbi:MAG: hypothetical protein WCT77_11585 [Bacteroidota bacterium]
MQKIFVINWEQVVPDAELKGRQRFSFINTETNKTSIDKFFQTTQNFELLLKELGFFNLINYRTILINRCNGDKSNRLRNKILNSKKINLLIKKLI